MNPDQTASKAITNRLDKALSEGVNKITRKKIQTGQMGKKNTLPAAGAKATGASFRVKTLEEIMAEKRHATNEQPLAKRLPSHQTCQTGLQVMEDKPQRPVCDEGIEPVKPKSVSVVERKKKETGPLPEYLPLSPLAKKRETIPPVLPVVSKRKWHHCDAFSTIETRAEEKPPKIHKIEDESSSAPVLDGECERPPVPQVATEENDTCTASIVPTESVVSNKPEHMQIEDWECEMADFEAFLMEV